MVILLLVTVVFALFDLGCYVIVAIGYACSLLCGVG